jgi:TRAP-type C4-dicarboxylate transport system permease large subunit
MVRYLLIFLAHMALPFVLFALRNWLWRLWLARRKNKKPEEVTVPKLDVARVLRFLFYGLLLFMVTLMGVRMSQDTPSPRTPRASDAIIQY